MSPETYHYERLLQRAVEERVKLKGTMDVLECQVACMEAATRLYADVTGQRLLRDTQATLEKARQTDAALENLQKMLRVDIDQHLQRVTVSGVRLLDDGGDIQ